MAEQSKVGCEVIRDEFVPYRTRFLYDRFVDLPRSGRYRFLDFGSGRGHSIEALLDIFPQSHFVGTDCDSGQMAKCVERVGSNPRVTLVRMTEPGSLEGIGSAFDVIQLSAVFEHLLPQERRTLMPELWRRLAVGGYLVVSETPWRWFPVDTHTTSLPLINYMPDRMALAALRHFSRFPFPKTISWHEALREGLRGATKREIVASIGAAAGAVKTVQSTAPDARDLLDVWWHGESRKTTQKKLAYGLLSAWRAMTGAVVSPWINMVMQKVR